ncbi:MAG: hypothetical protein II412_08715, partial [Clostridia bacterium]|nr:hypothetical protein [Clostridia bacterium]
ETPAYDLQVLVELLVAVAKGETVGGASTYMTKNKLADKFDFEKLSLISYATKLTEPHFMDTYSVIQAQINAAGDPGSRFVTLSPYTTSGANGGRPAHTHTYTYVPYEGYEPTCTEDGLGYRYCVCSNTNADYYDDYQKNVRIPATGHDWGTPTYAWAKEGSDWECTASAVCSRDASHVLTETVTAVRTEVNDVAVYTATFTNDLFVQQVKEVGIGYYLIGPDWMAGAIDPAKAFAPNPDAEGEYMLQTTLALGEEIKVVKVEDGAIIGWYPDGIGNQYTVDAAHKGNVTVYFRKTYQNDWAMFGGYIYIEAKPLAYFKKQNVVLSGQIAVNFYLDLSELSEDQMASSYMTFDISGRGTCTERDDFDPTCKNATGLYYGFTCQLNSVQMADTITATYHYGDGLTVSKDYSVKQYLITVEENASLFNAKIVNVLRALGDYGHYVQLFLAEENHWTIGTDYAEMDQFYTPSYDIDAVRTAVAGFAAELGTNADIEEVKYTLVLDSETAIKVFFKLNSAYTGSFSATIGSGTENAAHLQADGRYMVVIPNIRAQQLGTKYTIKATTDSGTAVTKVAGLSYVQNILNNENYTNKPNALNGMASLYYYYLKAYEYATN